MNVLVTGGAGFIGSHIVDRLVALGWHVTLLDNLSTGRLDHVHPAAELLRMDVTDPSLQRRLGPRHFDAVVHHAAQVSVQRSMADPYFDAQVNLVGTLNMLAYACRAGARRFVFASSAAVYGSPPCVPVREDAPARPLSPYGESKWAAEEYLHTYRCDSGTQIVILRYANVYGPRQSVHGEAGVVCALMHNLLTRRPIVIDGDGLQTRDFVYVEDVAQASVLALRPEFPSGVYNVGTGVSTSILDLYRLLVGPDVPCTFGPPRPGDVRHSSLDCAAIRGDYGWRPAVPLADGLARTWRYLFHQLESADRIPTALRRSPTAPLQDPSLRFGDRPATVRR